MSFLTVRVGLPSLFRNQGALAKRLRAFQPPCKSNRMSLLAQGPWQTLWAHRRGFTGVLRASCELSSCSNGAVSRLKYRRNKGLGGLGGGGGLGSGATPYGFTNIGVGNFYGGDMISN